jgi:hypothetical protein
MTLLPPERAAAMDNTGRTERFEDNLVASLHGEQIAELRGQLTRGVQAVVDRLDAFERHHSQIAKPFAWNFHPPRPRRADLPRRRPPAATQARRLTTTALTAATT